MKRLLRLLLLLLPLVVPACCRETPTTAAEAVCTVWQPLSYSGSKDTPETISGVLGNNAARASWCK